MLASAGILSGKLKRLEASEKLARLEICKNCPSQMFDSVNYKCRVCGCKGRFLKLKASVNLWKCPEGHWDGLPTVDIPAPLGYCEQCEAVIERKLDNGITICVNKHKTNLPK